MTAHISTNIRPAIDEVLRKMLRRCEGNDVNNVGSFWVGKVRDE